MVKRIQYEIDFKNNVSSVIKLLKEAQTAAQSIEDKEHSIKIGVDDKKLNNVLSKLEKTLTDFEKGTIDIKGLESLSKQLNDINVIAQKLSGIFDGIDTSSFSGLETSIGNIGKMIATLKDDIANVISEANKGNKTADIGGATKRINEEIKATEELAKAKKKLGQSEGKATERFADVERMNEVIDLFSRMESHLDSIKKALLDVGDGKEFSPLLKTINNVQSAVSGLEKSFSNMKLNMNFDIGNLNSEKADTKIAETNARRLAAYRDLLAKMKKTGKTTKDMVRFYEPENSSVTDLIGVYQNMIQEAEKKYATTVMKNGKKIKSNAYRDILGDNYKREVRLANDAFNRATKNKSKTSDFSDLFGKSNLSEIVSQLTLIVSKLDEIAVSASGLKDVFSNGVNIKPSIDEIDKLTNRVKELENELKKVKVVPSPVSTNDLPQSNSEKETMDKVSFSAENIKAAEREEQRFTEAIAKRMEQSEIARKAEDRRQELAQSKAINKALEQEYAERQKNIKAAEREEQRFTEAIAKRMEQSEIARKAEDRRQELAQSKAINKALEQEYAERQKNIKAAEREAELREKQAENFTKSASKKLISAISKYDYGDRADSYSMLNQLNKGLTFEGISIAQEDIFQVEKSIDSIIYKLKKSHEENLRMLNEEIEAEEKLQAQRDKHNKKNLNFIDLEIKRRNEESQNYSSLLKGQMSEKYKYVSSMDSIIDKFEKDYIKQSSLPNNKTISIQFHQIIESYRKAIESLKSEKERLSKTPFIEEKDLSQFRILQGEVQNLFDTIRKTQNSQRGTTELSRNKTIEWATDLLKKNTKWSTAAKNEVKELIYNLQNIQSINTEGVRNKILRVAQAEREAGREGKSWLSIFKEKKLYSFIGQAASMIFSFYSIIEYFRQGIEAVKAYDEGLTKMSYTMDLSKTQLDNLGDSVLETSRKLKSSVDNAMQVAQIYANMNTTAQEIDKLSQPTLIMSNLTGFDASTVADQIQAVTQQFDITAESSMHIADVYDQISRNISVDYSKIFGAYIGNNIMKTNQNR